MLSPTLICYGEVLWDVLPTGKIPGGAPMNVAYHANHLGVKSQPLSRVGNDDLGKELLAFLERKGLSTELIQLDEQLPTGTVEVTLDQQGSPSYEIKQNVAWDNVQLMPRDLEALNRIDALVFGSLASRGSATRNTLLQLLEKATLRVFDVNLRAPFYSQEMIETLFNQSDIVKMNEEELTIIAENCGTKGDEQTQMRFVKDRFELEIMVITKGAEGAICLDEQGFHQQPGIPITVQDTIGSGDAFLAGFITELLKGKDIPNCLAFAAKMGALVATKKGATPEISAAERSTFMNEKLSYDI